MTDLQFRPLARTGGQTAGEGEGEPAPEQAAEGKEASVPGSGSRRSQVAGGENGGGTWNEEPGSVGARRIPVNRPNINDAERKGGRRQSGNTTSGNRMRRLFEA